MRDGSSNSGNREGLKVADEVKAINRLGTLERLRDQARASHRQAMLDSIEKMIQAELRVLHRLREPHAGEADTTPGADKP